MRPLRTATNPREEVKMSSKSMAKAETKVPSYLAEKKMTGAGVSTDSADMLIPMVAILQGLSPQVNKDLPGYVEGALPGKFYLKNAPNPLMDEFVFQPCHFEKAVVEWLPRNKGGGGGGGFVAKHAAMPADAESKPSPENPDKMIMVRKNGNICADTRYHSGFVILPDGTPMPAVIPFTSTGHTVSRGWMFLMAQKQIAGQKADSWAIYYKITTKGKSRGNQHWYIAEITDAGEVDERGQPTTLYAPTAEDYERGRALNEGISSGARQYEMAPAHDDPDGDDGKI